ncbi:N-acetylmuramoyl-L-alanine amidase [Plantactinospora sp. GCM10030261]|uniref:N-acetylmuramoyl-L-alanine amidase n=1 Tax=Plantactinospora sp. GCM10030261 TaxID=3273420 RepID=UPI00361901FE
MHRPEPPPGGRVLIATALVAVATLVPAGGPATADPGTDGRQRAYARAATEYGVPESVLLGVSYLESRWNTNAGTPSTAAGYGPMHLTDARHVRNQPRSGHYGPAEDPRGDSARPALDAHRPVADPAPDAPALQTMDAAARLTGADPAALRTDPTSNIRGGAALLTAYQKALGGPVGAGSDPAAWFGAVARYSGAETTDAAAAFANEVYATIKAGAERTTDDGHRLRLPARAVEPARSWLGRVGLRAPKPRPDGLECPTTISCEWIPAPYEQYGPTVGDYGNHDLSDRPGRQKIEYIVIHDTEGSYATTLDLVQDPTYVSWHYTLRSVDGHIAQHVKTKDVAWHAGNWYVNAKSIGLEHEGFAAQGTWYTEAMYRNSAKLVRYLATSLGIPLDRQHIIGHDNVPGITPAAVAGMHWDPGPYWDWSHYFDLLRAPFWGTGWTKGGAVTIDPDFATHRPAFVGCDAPGDPCPSRGSSSVVLRTEPRTDAPLLNDLGLRPDGTPNTMHVSDHGSRVSAGQTYAVAERRGDWTAIWYLGQQGWFHNPATKPTAKWSIGLVAAPKAGRTSIPVYGRAYPEEAAYPEGVPYQTITPLQYTLPAGQRYVVGGLPGSEYYRATTVDGSSPGDWTVIRGETRYVQIQFGHRIMFVNMADVTLLPSPLGAP